MKIYHVYVKKYGYDEFDGLVVVAENKDRALEMVKVGYYGGCYFNERQGKIYIEEVDLTTEHTVLESYNAG
jgi:hypothetical protein